MGNVQTTGKVLPEMLAAALQKDINGKNIQKMAAHSTDWWFMTEDLPDPNNRISWEKGTVKISYTENNRSSFDRFKSRWVEILKKIDACDHIAVDIKVGINNVAHQCGTCRFGTDPKTSVLDINCRSHDVDNLYVVDSSFFPSSAALNPTHTLLANALRVGDHLLARLN
jgi:choline dehydrogenase-like flavoprotein